MEESEWYGMPSHVRDHLSTEFIAHLPGALEITSDKGNPEAVEEAADIVVEASDRLKFALVIAICGAGIFFGGVSVALLGAFLSMDPVLWVGLFVAAVGFIATGTWVVNHDPMEHYKHHLAANKAYARLERRVTK